MVLTKKERAIKKFEASMNRLDLLGEELTIMMTDENYVENARNSRQERMEKMKKRRQDGKLKPVARVKNSDEKLSSVLNEFKSRSPSSVQDIKDLTDEDFKAIRSLVSKMKKYSS